MCCQAISDEMLSALSECEAVLTGGSAPKVVFGMGEQENHLVAPKSDPKGIRGFSSPVLKRILEFLKPGKVSLLFQFCTKSLRNEMRKGRKKSRKSRVLCCGFSALLSSRSKPAVDRNAQRAETCLHPSNQPRALCIGVRHRTAALRPHNVCLFFIWSLPHSAAPAAHQNSGLMILMVKY